MSSDLNIRPRVKVWQHLAMTMFHRCPTYAVMITLIFCGYSSRLSHHHTYCIFVHFIQPSPKMHGGNELTSALHRDKMSTRWRMCKSRTHVGTLPWPICTWNAENVMSWKRTCCSRCKYFIHLKFYSSLRSSLTQLSMFSQQRLLT